MAMRVACGMCIPACRRRYSPSMKAMVDLSGMCHSDTRAALAPAARKDRARPTTPSPQISPHPLLQALRTTVAPSAKRAPASCTSSIVSSDDAQSPPASTSAFSSSSP
eukprot:1468687-Rhodomonas_salina.3